MPTGQAKAPTKLQEEPAATHALIYDEPATKACYDTPATDKQAEAAAEAEDDIDDRDAREETNTDIKMLKRQVEEMTTDNLPKMKKDISEGY